jgi:hypothetical protein
MAKNNRKYSPKYRIAKYLVLGLAFCFGTICLHKFALGYYFVAIGSLILSIFIPFLFLINFFLGIVESLIYLQKTPDEFVETYIKGRKFFF